MKILGHEITEEMLAESEVTKATIRRRLNRGWTIEEALYGKKIKTERIGGLNVPKEDIAKAKALGISKQMIRNRLAKGMTLEDALTTRRHANAKGMSVGDIRVSLDKLKIAHKNGVKDKTLRQRISNGWSVQRAITVPVKQLGRPSKHSQDFIDKAAKNGINRKAFVRRVYNGWSLEDAATIPYSKSRDDLTETEELLAMLGRMKYLNRTEDETYNPVSLMKKLKVTWDDIKEIKC